MTEEHYSYCAVCDADRVFSFKGEQHHEGKKIFDIYVCKKCNNSIALGETEEFKDIKTRKNDRLEKILKMSA